MLQPFQSFELKKKKKKKSPTTEMQTLKKWTKSKIGILITSIDLNVFVREYNQNNNRSNLWQYSTVLH